MQYCSGSLTVTLTYQVGQIACVLGHGKKSHPKEQWPLLCILLSELPAWQCTCSAYNTCMSPTLARITECHSIKQEFGSNGSTTCEYLRHR